MSAGSAIFCYDANGNMTQKIDSGSTTSYTYDAENRMTAVSGAAAATFVYDGDGNRVKGVVGGVTTTYIGNYFEWTGSASTRKNYYYAGGTRVAERDGNGTTYYWLLADHLGSTSITAYSSGGKKAEVRYKAWGETRYTYGTTPTSQRYTGQREESSLGLYWYASRWYSASLSRFVSPDSIIPQPGNPQAWDRYSYVFSNPVRYTDPSGHFSEEQLQEWYGEDWYDEFSEELALLLQEANFGDLITYEKNGKVYGGVFAQNGNGLVLWDPTHQNKLSIDVLNDDNLIGHYLPTSTNEFKLNERYGGDDVKTKIILQSNWRFGAQNKLVHKKVPIGVEFPSAAGWVGIAITVSGFFFQSPNLIGVYQGVAGLATTMIDLIEWESRDYISPLSRDPRLPPCFQPQEVTPIPPEPISK